MSIQVTCPFTQKIKSGTYIEVSKNMILNRTIGLTSFSKKLLRSPNDRETLASSIHFIKRDNLFLAMSLGELRNNDDVFAISLIMSSDNAESRLFAHNKLLLSGKGMLINCKNFYIRFANTKIFHFDNVSLNILLDEGMIFKQDGGVIVVDFSNLIVITANFN